MEPARAEARIVGTDNVLVVLSDGAPPIDDFCGSVVAAGSALPDLAGKTVYLCGDLARAAALEPALQVAARVFVVADGAQGDDLQWPVIDAGRVPVSVHGLGVLYRRLFDADVDYFARVTSEHRFQVLTESTKPGRAHRTGIYLTPVARDGEDLRFRLLRCSTNLSGPTESFRATDHHIVDALNQEAAWVLRGHAPLNHVLAQIYPNTPATDAQRQTKAKISPHADKTKDMPTNGIMAFCTFYDGLGTLAPMPNDPFDHGHRGTSAMTRLVFRRKSEVVDPQPTLPDTFTVTLTPGSVFLMPLSTNRGYTHEIRPSALDAARLPTRLGYVVRCSSAEAVHRAGRTYVGGQALQPATAEALAELRAQYAEENRSDAVVDYAERLAFSMNDGDYLPPGYEAADEFRQYPLPAAEDPFEALSASVRFEEIGRGRLGAVLVDERQRGVPLVRSTTSWARPAQRFGAAHLRLARRIQRAASLPFALDHALIERYTDDYATMGAHADQAQDLQDGSCIALFSCYRHAERAPSRRLVVEDKQDGSTFELPLAHGSVVVFSLDTNRRFRHKIVLDRAAPADNEWLGVTFRTARTFVRLRDGEPILEDGTRLTLADDEQRQALFRLRGRENREVDFVWPALATTISPADLLPPHP